MLIKPHNYSAYREVYADNHRIEVRTKITPEGHYKSCIVMLEDSYGIFGDSPVVKFHHTKEKALIDFPTNTLGKNKTLRKAKRLLDARKPNVNLPLEVAI